MFSQPLAPEENYARMYSGTAIPPEQWPLEWRRYIDSMLPLSTGKTKQRARFEPLPTYEGPGYELISKPDNHMIETLLVAVGAFTLGVVTVLLWGQRNRGEI